MLRTPQSGAEVGFGGRPWMREDGWDGKRAGRGTTRALSWVWGRTCTSLCAPVNSLARESRCSSCEGFVRKDAAWHMLAS
eukprot:358893-Chlamydomonas_euryale.AAC.4